MDQDTLFDLFNTITKKLSKEDNTKKFEREYTTRSGTKRSDNSGFSNALDDYGILSNLQRFMGNLQGKKHSDGVHGLAPGISHPGVTPNADMIGVDLNNERRMKTNQEIKDAEEKFKKKRIDELYTRLNKSPTGVPSKFDLEHTTAMEGEDTTLGYLAKGEKIMPVAVQKQYPELAIAVEQAIGSMGKNPQEFVVGSDKVKKNDKTGVEQFAWYDFEMPDMENIADYAKTGIDYVSNNPYAKSIATGALSAGAAKLGGASNQTSLATGIGAGVGSYGGQYLDQSMQKGGSFTNLPQGGTFDAGSYTDINSKGVLDSLRNLKGTVGNAEMYGAGLGGAGGALIGYKPVDMPDMPAPNVDTSQMSLSNIPMSNAPNVDFLASNDNPNYLARPSAELPIAPMFSMPSGVSYKNKVKDRDTGAFKYNSVDDEDQGGFMRNLNSSARRSGFGNSILV